MLALVLGLSIGVALAGWAGFAALDRAFPPDLSRLDQVGREALARDGRTLLMTPAPGGVWRLRATADEVSPTFRDMLLLTEDRRFYRHGGVDPGAVLRAAWQWARAGHVVSGGSTLTMQVARLLEPRPRTLRSKVIEAFRAVQLERRLSKDEILGAWLTLAPFGGNLEGVRAGAMGWFGVRPGALDRAQSALLVAIPRRPEALRPDRHPGRALALRDRLLGPDDVREPLPTARLAFPRHAEPALRPLLAAAPPGATVATTIDLPLQVALERLLAERLRGLPARASVGAMVADARSREVRAVVSGDGRAGLLDLTRAWRSPGSALKPFVYGLAFQDGLVSPGTPVNDLPRHFGRYAPENFDRTFAGTVTVAEALQRSLNLPAVALLDRIGPARFDGWLRAAGAAPALPRMSAASLPLVLGGAGMQVRGMVRLYAALATDGESRPLRLLQGDADGPALPLLQRSAAEMVAGVLTRSFPEGGPEGVAWKTGTSWGGRDAWGMGFDEASVAGVWVGRPDGTAMAGVTGVGVALPILAQVFGLLPGAPRPVAEVARAATDVRAPSGGLALLFPPADATIEAGGAVPIRVMGGRRPMLFQVDGAALASVPAGRSAAWQPGGPGFYTISVQDADGETVREQVRVR